MRRVTKENLIAQIDRLRKIKDEQGQLSMNGEYTLQAYEMLLAKMDAEPVGYFGRFDPDDEDIIDQCSKNAKGSFPLYRHAQPAPVVPELMVDWQENEFSAGWNACRAAMLNE